MGNKASPGALLEIRRVDLGVLASAETAGIRSYENLNRPDVAFSL